MVSFMARLRAGGPYGYKNLSQSSLESDEPDKTHGADNGAAKSWDSTSTSISRCHAICLYLLSLVLAVVMTLMLIADTTAASCDSGLGTYETGFHTEIRADKNTLALKRVKFHGGIVYDENGTASITPPPPGTPDFFGPPGRDMDYHWAIRLKDRFLKVDPKDWPSGGVKLLEQDLNYIRKSLSPEYYGQEAVEYNSTEPKPLSLHLRHCLNQVHQLLVCQLDLTPVPRTLREKPRVRHADVDQWHTCRDFDAMRAWMYPSEEHHT
ncbi:hypothetical protein CJF32_00006918 [Rutstroemia sp. NJR-2017a WRK4]|nr:hypothetical protein CJF32_00006918 [Rutstroemia sp. NJR-2017a WRK4]